MAVPPSGLRDCGVVVVACLAQAAPVLGVVVVEPKADQLAFVPGPVVGDGAGCEAVVAVSVVLVVADAEWVSGEYAWPESAFVCGAVAALLPCAACSVCGACVCCASSVGDECRAAWL